MGSDTLNSDIIWILLCGFLVVLMQAGFTCLESGLVRAKNSINVAMKNLVDFCASSALFALFGFALMFGESWNGLIGTSHFVLIDVTDPWLLAFFFFQMVFCGTATTIVSGAVAERMRFAGYFFTSVLIAGFIYPVVGHWAWAGADGDHFVGWLGTAGFIDFAGSTVVHSVGGWVALAALLVIGPRLGRFGKGGRHIEGHSLPMAALGVFLLWFGWFGFNGGSTLGLTPKVPLIITNTALAAAAGGLAALVLSWQHNGRPKADHIMNGVLAGLVAITASCHLMEAAASVVIGAVGGVVCIGGAWLLERLHIDDAIGAVPVHLFAGIWGTLAVAVLAPDGSWGDQGRLDQFLIQLQGIVTIGLYAFGVSYSLLRLAGRLVRLRVTPREERIGLNVAEHGASTSVLDLLTQMDLQARSGDFKRPVKVEPETEAAQVALFYNAVLEKFRMETDRRHMAMHKLVQLANYDTLTGLANRRLFFDTVRRALARAARNRGTGAVLYFDLDGFKRVNDRLGHEAGDKVLKEVARRMNGCIRENDLLARLGGDEYALLLEDSGVEAARQVAEKIIDIISDPFPLDGEQAHIGVSVGIALFSPELRESVKSVLRKADHAMYVAKLAGKGVVRFYTDEPEEFAPAL